VAYDMYQEIILQHYRSPRNFGALDHPTLVGEESNPLCGDHIRMQLTVEPSTRVVQEVRFDGDGCAISMASASMLTERLKGRSIEEVSALTREDVLKLVAIPLSPVRIKCALTGFAALGHALHPASSRSTDPTDGPAPA
jgi:nitrogen fixation protein NifU and related proteins